MSPIIWAALLAAILVSTLAATGARGADSFAKRVNLAIDADAAPRIARRLNHRRVGAVTGAVIAVVLIAVVSLTSPGFADADWSALVAMGAVFAGFGIGVGVGALRSVEASEPLPARVGRLRVPTVADYVPAYELWGTRVLVAAVAVLYLAAAAATFLGAVPGDALATMLSIGGAAVIAAVLCLTASEFLGRRVVRHRREAGSAAELAWDDALTASALRDLTMAPFFAAVAAIVLVVQTVVLSRDLTDQRTAAIVLAALFGGLVLTAVTLAVVEAASRPQLHYQRRLWPELSR